MTRNELVDAYSRGEVDRRGFIARLTAMGVSATAAAVYATNLAPGASAASPSVAPGYFMRAQGTADPDEMYGTAFVIEVISEAIDALTTALQAIVDSLSDVLASFTEDDFVAGGLEPNVSELLQRISDQISEQMAALTAFLGTIGGTSSQRAFVARAADADAQSGTADSLADILATLVDEYTRLVGLEAAIAPALDSGEGRQLVTNISLVSARQAAVISTLAGVDPLPAVFEVPIDPESPQPTA